MENTAEELVEKVCTLFFVSCWNSLSLHNAGYHRFLSNTCKIFLYFAELSSAENIFLKLSQVGFDITMDFF